MNSLAFFVIILTTTVVLARPTWTWPPPPVSAVRARTKARAANAHDINDDLVERWPMSVNRIVGVNNVKTGGGGGSRNGLTLNQAVLILSQLETSHCQSRREKVTL
jgi:hypothetical protein